MRLAFFLPLVACCGMVEAGLQERLETAATAQGEERSPAIELFLRDLAASDAPPREKLRYAWLGYFLAGTDAQRLQVRNIAAAIPLPETRMLLFGLTDHANLEKPANAALKALDEELAKLPGAKKDKAGRVTFGSGNPYDKMALFEKFEEPPPWVGRWTGQATTVFCIPGNYGQPSHQRALAHSRRHL